MQSYLPPLRLTGAQVLREGEIQRRSVALDQGRIVKGPLPEVDLTGYYILPGIIDLHGDAFERHIAPAPAHPSLWPTLSPPPTGTRPQTG